jgi:hypothetical protein
MPYLPNQLCYSNRILPTPSVLFDRHAKNYVKMPCIEVGGVSVLPRPQFLLYKRDNFFLKMTRSKHFRMVWYRRVCCFEKDDLVIFQSCEWQRSVFAGVFLIDKKTEVRGEGRG